MSELEDLIRDSMRTREGDAPQPGGLLAGVAARERVRRRRLQIATAGGTALAVVAVLLVAGPVGHLAGGARTPAQSGPGGAKSAQPSGGTPPVASSPFLASLVRTSWTLQEVQSTAGVWEPDARVQASLTLTDDTFTASDICDSVGGTVTYDTAGQRLTFEPKKGIACSMASPAPGTVPLRLPPGYDVFFSGTVSASVTETTLTLRSPAGAILTFRASTPATTPPSSGASGAPSPSGALTVCGAWSAATAPFARSVAHDYGAIESCFRYDAKPTSWVVTTDGVNGGPGYIGIDQCTTAGCASGLTDPTRDHWVYRRADRPGAVRLYAPPGAGQPLQITVGGHRETFDVPTATFGTPSSIGPAGIPGLPVTGSLQMVGGPAPGAVINVPGTVLFHSSNGVNVTAPVGEDGRFKAAVPAGRYTVTGTSPNYNGGHGKCGGVTVTVPGTVPVPYVHIYCQMK